MHGAFEGTGYSTFLLAHYLLAIEYHGVATRVPDILMGKPRQQPSKLKSCLHRMMLFLNGFSGVLDVIAFGLYYEQLDVKQV